MTNPSIYPILDRLDVVYRVDTKVRTDSFLADATFFITVGLYAGVPTANTLISAIASRGICPDDLEAHFLKFGTMRPRDFSVINAMVAEIQEIFDNPAKHSRITLSAEIVEVQIDEGHVIAQRIGLTKASPPAPAGSTAP